MTVDAPPRRIVCGVSCQADDREGGVSLAEPDRHTAIQALELAARSGGEVSFLHVVDWLPEREDGPSIVEAVREQLREDLEAIGREAESRGVPFRHEMRLGHPWRQLLAFADEQDADVVALSPRSERRKSLGSRIFHGSTASQVLKHATRPVWIVEPDSDAPRRILALLDLTLMSERVVAAARTLAGLYGADLLALACLDYPGDIALHRLPRAREAIRKYHGEVRAKARERLESLTGDDPSWQLLLGEDWVVRLAPRLIEDRHIDLVVMGAVSKPRLAGLLGTTAQRLLDHVSVSTWVIRPERQGAPGDPDD